MKRRDLDDLFRRLHASFPGLQLGHGCMYERSVRPILRGFIGSAFTKDSNRVEVAAFARPMYVPPDALSLGTFSKTARRSLFSLRDSWDIRELQDTRALADLAHGMRRSWGCLGRIATPLAFSRYATWCFGRGNDDVTGLVRGLSLARGGRYREAASTLLEIQKRDPSRFIPAGVREAADQILPALQGGQEDLVQALLERWETETAQRIPSWGLGIVAT